MHIALILAPRCVRNPAAWRGAPIIGGPCGLTLLLYAYSSPICARALPAALDLPRVCVIRAPAPTSAFEAWQRTVSAAVAKDAKPRARQLVGEGCHERI
eukprot:237681-Prymnesium_polylepis.1